MSDTAPGTPAGTPQVLLTHHLKALKLPTFLREYDKLARQCATDAVDHVRYLLRPHLAETGRAGADRAGTADGRAAHQGGEVPGGQKPRQLRLPGAAVAEQGANT